MVVLSSRSSHRSPTLVLLNSPQGTYREHHIDVGHEQSGYDTNWSRDTSQPFPYRYTYFTRQESPDPVSAPVSREVMQDRVDICPEVARQEACGCGGRRAAYLLRDERPARLEKRYSSVLK